MKPLRLSLVALAVVVVLQAIAINASADCGPCGGVLCQVPLTKSYRIQPGYCPTQVACMISQNVPCDANGCCAPYGVPPVFASGDFVVVRQSLEGHDRVAKYLRDLGVYIPARAAP